MNRYGKSQGPHASGQTTFRTYVNILSSPCRLSVHNLVRPNNLQIYAYFRISLYFTQVFHLLSLSENSPEKGLPVGRTTQQADYKRIKHFQSYRIANSENAYIIEYQVIARRAPSTPLQPRAMLASSTYLVTPKTAAFGFL